MNKDININQCMYRHTVHRYFFLKIPKKYIFCVGYFKYKIRHRYMILYTNFKLYQNIYLAYILKCRPDMNKYKKEV